RPDAGLIQVQPVGVGNPTCRDEEVRSREDARRTLGGMEGQFDPAAGAPPDALDLGFHEHFHPILAQDLRHFLGDIGILAGQQLLPPLHDRHPAAEPAEHLPELEPDVAAAHDQEVLGNLAQIHDRRRVQGGNAVEAGHRGLGRPGPRVNEDEVGGESPDAAVVQPDLQRLGPAEDRLPHDQVDARGAQDPLPAAAPPPDDRPLPLADPGLVDTDGTGAHPVVASPPGQIGDAGARHHRLRGGAALVDARAPDMLSLDHGGLPAGPNQALCERSAGLAGTDDDRIVPLGACLQRHVSSIPRTNGTRCLDIPAAIAHDTRQGKGAAHGNPAGGTPGGGLMSQDHRPPRIRTWIFRIALAAIAIAILLMVRYFYYAAGHPSTDDAFVQGDTVLISAKISGRVSQVLVEGDQRVTKEQLLVVLDPTDAQIEVRQAEAALAAAKTQVMQAQAALQSAEAQATAAAADVKTATSAIAAARAARDRTQRDYARSRELVAQGAIGPQQLDADHAAADVAEAQYQSALTQLTSATDGARSGFAVVKQREAQVAA